MEVSEFQKKLIQWFRQNKRELPWRGTRDFYKIWVSEVMLQQTQVSKVLDYYRRFLEQFPSLKEIAEADLEEVLRIWQGLGYYSRARNFHRASRILMEKYQGKPPEAIEEFKKLPGVGDYIAAAVYSLAFGIPEPAIDGNVKRVITRIFRIAVPIDNAAGLNEIRECLNKVFDTQNPADFNQAMMELGAIICKPKNPKCPACPISEFCAAWKNSDTKKFPLKLTKRSSPVVEIAVAFIKRDGKIFLARRKPYGLLGGLWELPGGRVASLESPEQACVRALAEKFNLEISVRKFLIPINHTYSHFKLKGHVFACNANNFQVKLRDHDDYGWIAIDEINQLPIHAAHLKILKRLL